VRFHYVITLRQEAMANEEDISSCLSALMAREVEICAYADKIRRHRDDIPQDHWS
jgi:hypothetical protein